MGAAIEPASLAGAVRYIHGATGLPVVVTEHGIAVTDDAHRAAFIGPSLDLLSGEINSGIPVLGYFHWTLMDNFEWVAGYSSQLGLHEVDRTTFERTAKPSAGVYAAYVGAVRTRTA